MKKSVQNIIPKSEKAKSKATESKGAESKGAESNNDMDMTLSDRKDGAPVTNKKRRASTDNTGIESLKQEEKKQKTANTSGNPFSSKFTFSTQKKPEPNSQAFYFTDPYEQLAIPYIKKIALILQQKDIAQMDIETAITNLPETARTLAKQRMFPQETKSPLETKPVPPSPDRHSKTIDTRLLIPKSPDHKPSIQISPPQDVEMKDQKPLEHKSPEHKPNVEKQDPESDSEERQENEEEKDNQVDNDDDDENNEENESKKTLEKPTTSDNDDDEAPSRREKSDDDDENNEENDPKKTLEKPTTSDNEDDDDEKEPAEKEKQVEEDDDDEDNVTMDKALLKEVFG
jgi:hypothetical protein